MQSPLPSSGPPTRPSPARPQINWPDPSHKGWPAHHCLPVAMGGGEGAGGGAGGGGRGGGRGEVVALAPGSRQTLGRGENGGLGAF